jgi:signal peptide peptidase SppA
MQRENLVDCSIQRELAREMLVSALDDNDRSTPNVLRALRDFIDGRRAVKPHLAHFGATADAVFSTEKTGAASLTLSESSASVESASANTEEVASELPFMAVQHVHGDSEVAGLVHGGLERIPHSTKPKFRAVSDYNEEFAFFRDAHDLWSLVTGRLTQRGNQVAVLFAAGDITETGKPGSLVSTTFLRSVAQAAHDSRVGALVVHINSPGGDAVASESMRAALQHVSDVHRKPVVVSMGPAAASGGYLMALGADSIVAMPTTITGSIGVLSMRFGLERAARHFGVTSDAVRTHRGSVLLSPFTPLTDEHRKTLDTVCGEVYADFRANVQKSRKLTPAQIDYASQGKIWSGSAAQTLGLVDRIGGLHTAVAEAGRLLLQSRVLAQANHVLGPGRPIEPLKQSDIRLLMNYQAVPAGLFLDAAPMLSVKAGSIANDAEALSALGRRMVAACDPTVPHVANMFGAGHASAGAAAVHGLLNESHGGGQGSSRVVQLRADVPSSRDL